MRELALGARLTLAGGRTGLLRTAITALGVALGVAVLLVAASIPSIHDGRQARGEARFDLGFDAGGRQRAPACSWPMPTRASARATCAGGCCRPKVPAHRLPPGLPRVPRAGEVFVSPALRRPARHAGRAAAARAAAFPGASPARSRPSGLLGPTDLAFYAGASGLVEGGGVRRLERFGATGPHAGWTRSWRCSS